MSGMITIPVIKAWRNIFPLLKCAAQNPYYRRGFEECILELFKGKSVKSVFRGMTIPTLRSLGLIVGFGDNIRASANGYLLHGAQSSSFEEGKRVLRVLLLELDSEIGILSHLSDGQARDIEELYEGWIPKIELRDRRIGEDAEKRRRAASERIGDWIAFLSYAQLVVARESNIIIDPEAYLNCQNDAKPHAKIKEKLFQKFLFSEYRAIVDSQKGIETVELDQVRAAVALEYYKGEGLILSERQFDALLSDLPKTSKRYTISFGRSMGAEEKLFFFRGKYFQTLSIRLY